MGGTGCLILRAISQFIVGIVSFKDNNQNPMLNSGGKCGV